MEEAREFSPARDSPATDIVLEKRLIVSSEPATHVQLACGPRHCAFPLDGSGLCVWNTSDPSDQLLILRGHHQPITAVAFGNSEDPLLVCSASQDYVILWNLDESREKVAQGLTPRGTAVGTRLGKVSCMRFSPSDHTVAVCAGSKVLMLDLEGQGSPTELQGHQSAVTAVDFCPWQADMLVSVSEDRSFKVWDVRAGSLLHCSSVLSAYPLLSLLVDSEHRQMVTGDADGQLWVFSLQEGHGFRCLARADLRTERARFCRRRDLSRLNPPEGPRGGSEVDAAVPVLSLVPCDLSGLLGPACAPLVAGAVWVGSSEGLLLLRPASSELEAMLRFCDFRRLSIQVAGSCALSSGGCRVFCLLSSLFGSQIALLEVRVDALLRAQPIPGLGRGLSVLPSSCVPPTSPLYLGTGKRKTGPAAPKQSLPGLRGTVKDQPLVFHRQVRSSGYTAAPRMTMFSPKTNKTNGAGKRPSRGKNRRNRDQDPWERPLPASLRRQCSSVLGQAAVICVQFSGDGRRLACGLADHLCLVLDAELTRTPVVLSGHDGAVNSVSWSHSGRWLLTASQDCTLRVWEAHRAELALSLGAGLLSRPVPVAQFFYMDTFLLLASGPKVQLFSFHLDTSKDDIQRYKQRSWGKLVFGLALTGGAEVTSLSAVNDFYSHVVLTAGRNRTLEVFDLSVGRSAALVPEAHSRPIHHICQNAGSPFTSQAPQNYNLFATAALGEGIRMWDLRTLRCERRFEGHQARCYPCGLVFSPCGHYVACGSEDRQAYVYDVGSGTFSHRLAGHTDTVTAVTFRPSAPQLITATLDGSLQLFVAE